jgi:hypothetical protein
VTLRLLQLLWILPATAQILGFTWIPFIVIRIYFAKPKKYITEISEKIMQNISASQSETYLG